MALCTVTGNLNTLMGTPIPQGSLIQFFLTNLAGAIPESPGGLLITQQASATTNYDGTFSVQLTGNDTISPLNTLYLVQFPIINGKGGVPNYFYYSITGSSFNLNTASPAGPPATPVFTNAPVLLNPLGPQTITNFGLTVPSLVVGTPAGGNEGVGSINISGGLYFNGVPFSSSNTNGTAVVNGSTYALTAAGINLAIASFGGNPGIVYVPYGGNYSDAVITLTAGMVLVFGVGTFTIAGIRLPDSMSGAVSSSVVGQGPQLTIVQLANSINADCIADTNFSSFTGGSNFWGTFRVYIANLTVDGNKTNNTSGYGIRMYGRGYLLENGVVQNCKNDGLWLEWGGTENDVVPADDIESAVSNFKGIYNGGNGITHKGPNDLTFVNFKSYANGLWGVDSFSSFHCHGMNLYENPSGGLHVEATSGGLDGSDLNADTGNTGWGMLIEAGGTITLAGSNVGGGIPLEVRGSGGGVFQGVISNPSGTNPYININGGGNYVIEADFVPSTNPTNPLVAFTSETAQNFISGLCSVDPTSLYTGSPSGTDYINLKTSTKGYYQIPAATTIENTFSTNFGYTQYSTSTYGALCFLANNGASDDSGQKGIGLTLQSGGTKKAGLALNINSGNGSVSEWIQGINLTNYSAYGMIIQNGDAASTSDLQIIVPVDGTSQAIGVRNNASTTNIFNVDRLGNTTGTTLTITGATPTVAGGQIGLGVTTGFGNGSSGTAVTTTTKSTGTGPTTAQTIVDYLKVSVGGTVYWLPLMQ